MGGGREGRGREGEERRGACVHRRTSSSMNDLDWREVKGEGSRGYTNQDRREGEEKGNELTGGKRRAACASDRGKQSEPGAMHMHIQRVMHPINMRLVIHQMHVHSDKSKYARSDTS